MAERLGTSPEDPEMDAMMKTIQLIVGWLIVTYSVTYVVLAIWDMTR